MAIDSNGSCDLLRFAVEDVRLGAKLVGQGRMSMQDLERCLDLQEKRGGPERARLRDIIAESGVALPGEAGREAGEAESAGDHEARTNRGGTPSRAEPAPREEPAGSVPGSGAARILPSALRYGRYEVRREIGRGAAGVILEAWDAESGRTVAIKALRLQPRAGST